MRGRKRRSPKDEADRGHPGRRKGAKTKKRAAEQAAMPPAAKAAAAAEAAFALQPVPTAPDWLSRRACAIWAVVAADLTARRVLRAAHHGQLARYCELFSTWIDAQATIAENGTTYEAKSIAGGMMTRIHPAVKIARDTERELRQIEDRFGLNPVYGAALAHRTAQLDENDPSSIAPDSDNAGSAAHHSADGPIGILVTSSKKSSLN